MTASLRQYLRHDLVDGLYRGLPDSVKPVARGTWHGAWSALGRAYYGLTPAMSDQQYHAAFVEDVFHGRTEYARYVEQFDRGPAAQIVADALERYEARAGRDWMAGVGLERARDFYAVVRHLEPETVVETGVANGVSTLAILLALDANEWGHLRSVDYPVRAGDDLAAFRDETFEDAGAPIIPPGADPGWLIPDDLRDRWALAIGKSQRQLPQMLPRGAGIDLFVHDSEHSHPCMMMEYELAHEWLRPGGVIISDDIRWNDAFDVFCDVRAVEHGRLSRGVGYMRKPEEEVRTDGGLTVDDLDECWCCGGLHDAFGSLCPACSDAGCNRFNDECDADHVPVMPDADLRTDGGDP